MNGNIKERVYETRNQKFRDIGSDSRPSRTGIHAKEYK